MDATKTTIYYAIIIASTLVGVILAFFVVILIRNHRRNQTLYKDKIRAEITTLENERKRMAADLHDGLGPVLVGIKMKLNSISVADKEDQDTLDKAIHNLDGMMSKMKEISNDLLPAVLIKKGLVEAIRFFIEDVHRHSRLQTKCSYTELPPLTEQLSINIYRIILELMQNTIKHADAKNLAIELHTQNGFLILQTSDDGKGFDYDNAMKNHLGLGLRNLLSRAELLNGKIFIESKKGTGTRYSFEIPL